MKSLTEFLMWIIAGLMAAATIIAIVLAYAVWLSVTWPWYMFRGARRIARPR